MSLVARDLAWKAVERGNQSYPPYPSQFYPVTAPQSQKWGLALITITSILWLIIFYLVSSFCTL